MRQTRGVEVLRDTFDRPTLTRGVATLEDHHESSAAGLYPLLHLNELTVQAQKLLPIRLLLHPGGNDARSVLPAFLHPFFPHCSAAGPCPPLHVAFRTRRQEIPDRVHRRRSTDDNTSVAPETRCRRDGPLPCSSTSESECRCDNAYTLLLERRDTPAPSIGQLSISAGLRSRGSRRPGSPCGGDRDEGIRNAAE